MEKKEPGANSGASNTAKKARRNEASEDSEANNSVSSPQRAGTSGTSNQGNSSSGSGSGHSNSGHSAQPQAQVVNRSAQSSTGSPDNSRNHSGQHGQRQRNQSANSVAGYLSANSNGSSNSGSRGRNGSPRTNRSRNHSHSRERGDRERHREADNVTEGSPENDSANTANRASNDSSPQSQLEDQAVAQVEQSAAVSSSSLQNGPAAQEGSVQQQAAAAVAAAAAAYNWQSSKTTLKERLAFMFNNEIMADVHFVVGKGSHTQRIPAHKFVLSIGSAVFDAMFNGGMATQAEEVELPDVEPAAFLALLKFLYSDEVQIGPETVMTTLYTAKKYVVPALEKACVDFLKRNLSSDNALMLLTQARLFDEPQLAALCLETIDKNTTEALAAEGFCDIDLNTLCVVLERDTLGIRECKLFSAVCRWAEAECIRQNLPTNSEHRRRTLRQALQLIRFPLMTVEEFAVGAAQSGILSDREVVELFLHFTVNPKPTVNFLDTPRCCLTGKEQVVSRFCQIESRWGYSGTSDRIR